MLTYYHQHGRHDLPWRRPEPGGSFDPYKILVSEIMLQQTQVVRVIPKFEAFTVQFPTVQALASSNVAEVLRAWQGLGYNRRAKFLWLAAQQVVTDFNGRFPNDAKQLQCLPGVGVNTAGAILAYAFNQPTMFIETNIRTVYIHDFFKDETDISDQAVRDMLALTLDTQEPRVFYWALMDYGSYLKKAVGNLSRSSKSYAKQTSFHGSRRQIRGQVIRLLLERPHMLIELGYTINDERLTAVLADLEAEQLIVREQSYYKLLAD